MIVLSIVGLSTYSVIFACYAQEIEEGGTSRAVAIPVVVVYCTLIFMMMWSYFATVFTDPGRVPPGWQPTSDPAPNQENSRGRGACLPVGARWCKRCLVWKPDRCHHCSVCGHCVLKMDHHCVWVVNCVGGNNYKFFLLFLFYTFLTSVFATTVLIPFFIKVFGYEADKDSLSDGEAAAVFMSVVLDIAFAFSVAGFLAMHITLVFSNTTTIEMYEKKRSSPWRYDLGRRKNFEQVFGSRPIHWIFPFHFTEDLPLVESACGLADHQTLRTNTSVSSSAV
ncbi:hypothetical protein CYMTET_9368 [Cymbomonas tetramitiformis]|uniref:S-acyltransferase n=1 Tax=Cymbomonas tetramitiformis TaxID=36881 RepID=A0AAE0GRL8_9CHLO|nr:hypothetical protein CYMTET_9368 [Cymbomonas tetramitiformis]